METVYINSVSFKSQTLKELRPINKAEELSKRCKLNFIFQLKKC